MNPMTKQMILRITGKFNAAGWIDVREDDSFLVSYPRSGNTWLRFLVGNLIVKNKIRVDLTNIEKIVPDIYLHNIYFFNKLPNPRVLKSHECFDPRYERVLYIVRDPRDVALSFWHYKVKKGLISEDYPFEIFIKEFILGKSCPFGSWQEHVGCWIGARENDNKFLLVRYEDVIADPLSQVQRIANHFGLSTFEDDVCKSIQQSSFNSLQNLEKKQSKHWKALRGSSASENFFRNGQSESWRTDMPEHLAQMIGEEWKFWLEKLGYPIK